MIRTVKHEINSYKGLLYCFLDRISNSHIIDKLCLNDKNSDDNALTFFFIFICVDNAKAELTRTPSGPVEN